LSFLSWPPVSPAIGNVGARFEQPLFSVAESCE
jgi:hypothetical protein